MFNIPEMEIHKVIENLKPRSGKSMKFTIKHVCQKDSVIRLLLLSNATEKICIIPKTQELDKMNVTTGNTYLVKNLEHVVTNTGIPVFKITVQTTFKKSGLKIEGTDFNQEEVQHLKSLDAGPFLPETVQTANIHQDVNQNENLTLLQFTQMRPRSSRDDQFVEVSELFKFNMNEKIFFSWLYWADNWQVLLRGFLVAITRLLLLQGTLKIQ